MAAQERIEGIAREVVVAVLIDLARQQLLQLLVAAVARVARANACAEIEMVIVELRLGHLAVVPASPARVAFAIPRPQERTQHAIKPVRQLMRQRATERRHVAPRKADHCAIAALEAAGPPERHALGLHVAHFWNDQHRAHAPFERVLLVVRDKARVVLLDLQRSAKQRLGAARRLDAVLAGRAHRDAGIGP